MEEATLANMKQLPLELRNEVYDNILEDIASLEMPGEFEGSMLDYLHAQLPEFLKAEPQFAEEAAMAYLRRTACTAESIKVPSPRTFETPLPSSMKWDNVRELEFTAVQQCYSSPTEGQSGHRVLSIEDIASRCPKLETLIIWMEDSAIVPEGDTGIPHTTEFFQVISHPNIRQLTLKITNAAFVQVNRDYCYRERFIPFTEAFKQQAEEAGREINLTVALSPRSPKVFSSPEISWKEDHGITWVQYYCYFG